MYNLPKGQIYTSEKLDNICRDNETSVCNQSTVHAVYPSTVPHSTAQCGWVSGNEKLMKLLANLGWWGRRRGREEERREEKRRGRVPNGCERGRSHFERSCFHRFYKLNTLSLYLSLSSSLTHTETHKHTPSLSAHSSTYILFFVKNLADDAGKSNLFCSHTSISTHSHTPHSLSTRAGVCFSSISIKLDSPDGHL